MTVLHIYFRNAQRSLDRPVICDPESIVYTCDGAEGTLSFDGYYYIEDHAPPYPGDSKYTHRYPRWLPATLQMEVSHREDEPYAQRESEDGTTYFYRKTKHESYVVEIYRRDTHESTDRISKVEDGDEMMDVCFFPTNRQTLYFRVLETRSVPELTDMCITE